MSDDLQAQPGKQGNSYQMRRVTTEKSVILKVGQETCRTRSNGVWEDWMVWGAPFHGEEVSEPHLELKTSENQLSYRCFEENNRRQKTRGKISHLLRREGEPPARACPLGSELE